MAGSTPALRKPRAVLRQRERRRPRFWLLVIGAAVFMSLEPGLFLVSLALALSALALFWILLLAGLLVSDAVASARSPKRDGPARR